MKRDPDRADASLPTLTRTDVGHTVLPDGPAPGQPAPLAPGHTIRHYEIIRELGRGGMGAVYLARDTRLGRLVAIKVLGEHGGVRARRFLVEARATARCRHPNIVVIHEVDEVEDCPYMVLEYLEGTTLRAWMNQRRDAVPARGVVPPGRAVELMVPVVRALICAHELGIVHRDLKPENIVLDSSGVIKVLDFGIAKVREHDHASVREHDDARGGDGAAPSGNVAVTRDGAVLGTMPYMAPEQWSARDVDARSDIWAAGVMLYELVTGAHPLDPVSPARLITIADIDTPMPSLSEHRPELGPLAGIIDRCLQKPRDERMASARALLAELEPLLPGYRALELSEDDNPFAGLAAFQEADAARFFGRDDDIAGMVTRLRNHCLVAVAGPSGAGKSSFVRAGVVPALKRSGESWEVFIVRPGRHPMAALADVLDQLTIDTASGALRRAASSSGALPQGPDSDRTHGDDDTDSAGTAADSADHLASRLHAEPGYLGARLRARCRNGGRRAVLFVDQFEELYTLGADRDQRAAFVACLEGVADDAASPLRVILAMRSDFLDRLAEDRQLVSGTARGLLFLPPLGRDSLRQALLCPLEAAGYRCDSDMVESMLDALETTRGPLPLLQFTATKLWEARDRQGRRVTRESYQRIGGVAGALSTHADAVLAGLPPRQQTLARAVFLRLVTPERTRAVVTMDELGELCDDRAAVVQVIQQLAEARLVLMETGAEGATVELVHESLIERWPTLRRWLDDSEDDAQFLARVRAASHQWQASGRSEDMLWRGAAARDAERWFERWQEGSHEGSHEGGRAGAEGDLGKREERYLRAVVALAERSRRQRRRLAVAAFVAMTAVALALTYLAVRAGREAERADQEAARVRAQKAEIEREAVRARNATRMAVARELSDDATTVLALLREIEPPDVPRGWPALADAALHGQLAGVQLNHPDRVNWAAYSPDGARIVTASDDYLARVWRVDANGNDDGDGDGDGDGGPVELRGHHDRVIHAEFSPDGMRVVTASMDKTARIWRVDGRGEPVVLAGHGSGLWSAAFSRDGRRVITASDDFTARIWNADGSGEPVVLAGHENRLYTAGFSPDGARVVTGSMDKTARIWSADGSGEPVVLRGHEDSVTAAAFSPDGARVATASADRTVRIWAADGSGEIMVLRGHTEKIASLAFSPDGGRLITASADRSARIFTLGTGQSRVIAVHSEAINAAGFSPDGAHVVTASWDGGVRIWNADDRDAPRVFRGHDATVWEVEFSSDGERMLTASDDGTARLWNADGTGQPVVLSGHDQGVWTAQFSPDGMRILTSSPDGTARIWNVDGRGEPAVLRGHESVLRDVEFSPDGKRILTSSRDGTARIWNVDGRGEPVVLRGHEQEIWGADLSPDGTRVATSSGDGTARIWNVDGKGEPVVLGGHTRPVRGVRFSPDGARLVTISEDKTARIWDAAGHREPVVLRGHDSGLYWVSWSPDSRRVITVSADKTARIWNVDGRGEPVVLRGHEDRLYFAQFSPDGRLVVTTSGDRTARVWNADGSGYPRILRGHEGDVWWADFSPDGTRVATASSDRTMRIWTGIEPLSGVDDPRLWTATRYCMSIEQRQRLMGVSQDTARANHEACVRRVRASRE